MLPQSDVCVVHCRTVRAMNISLAQVNFNVLLQLIIVVESFSTIFKIARVPHLKIESFIFWDKFHSSSSLLHVASCVVCSTLSLCKLHTSDMPTFLHELLGNDSLMRTAWKMPFHTLASHKQTDVHLQKLIWKSYNFGPWRPRNLLTGMRRTHMFFKSAIRIKIR